MFPKEEVRTNFQSWATKEPFPWSMLGGEPTVEGFYKVVMRMSDDFGNNSQLVDLNHTTNIPRK